jgi:mRNA-degrading endonuclease RelE of RelBE toxin-antitoxin system
MQIKFSARFKDSYKQAPERVRKNFNKQGRYLLKNLRHPSLHAKKYDERQGIWQARVNRDWRFYFVINGEIYRCIDMMHHPK